MMGSEELPDVSRLTVLFLRLTAGMSQAELGRAAGLSQSVISRLESGPGKPSAEALQQVAAAAGIPWHLVAHVRGFVDSFLRASRGEAGGFKELKERVEERNQLLLSSPAVRAYLLEDLAASPSPSELRLEAERFWDPVKDLPSPRRRRAVEFSPKASRSWALAERLCHESETAALESPKEALELAELALAVAGRAEGEEDWKRRLQGYAWAYVGNARRAANDHAGADAAFAKAWELWRSGSDPEGLLKEERLLSLEAALRREEG